MDEQEKERELFEQFELRTTARVISVPAGACRVVAHYPDGDHFEVSLPTIVKATDDTGREWTVMRDVLIGRRLKSVD